MTDDDYKMNFVVGYTEDGKFSMLGLFPPTNGYMVGSDGRNYDNITRWEPFNEFDPAHAEFLPYRDAALLKAKRKGKAVLNDPRMAVMQTMRDEDFVFLDAKKLIKAMEAQYLSDEGRVVKRTPVSVAFMALASRLNIEHEISIEGWTKV